MDSYYASKLAEGQQYEDYIYTWFEERGLKLTPHKGKEAQLKGENKEGLEIKRDGRWRETGNLYIETAEKSTARRRYYVPSGIYRKDNTRFFLIGDEQAFFVFKKQVLQKLAGRYYSVSTPTSQGYLLPVDDARKVATFIWQA